MLYQKLLLLTKEEIKEYIENKSHDSIVRQILKPKN